MPKLTLSVTLPPDVKGRQRDMTLAQILRDVATRIEHKQYAFEVFNNCAWLSDEMVVGRFKVEE